MTSEERPATRALTNGEYTPEPQEEWLEPRHFSRAAGIGLALGAASLFLCLGFLTGVPAVAACLVAIKRIDRSRGALLGRRPALVGLVMGLLGTIISLLLLPTVLPYFGADRARAREQECTAQVEELTQACLQYAAAHAQRWPATWSDVQEYVGGTDELAKLLVCPAGRGSDDVSYALVHPGGPVDSGEPAAADAIVREVDANHHGGHIEGFADGTVDWVSNDLEEMAPAAPDESERGSGRE